MPIKLLAKYVIITLIVIIIRTIIFEIILRKKFGYNTAVNTDYKILSFEDKIKIKIGSLIIPFIIIIIITHTVPYFKNL